MVDRATLTAAQAMMEAHMRRELRLPVAPLPETQTEARTMDQRQEREALLEAIARLAQRRRQLEVDLADLDPDGAEQLTETTRELEDLLARAGLPVRAAPT
jgi:hypothetical protein